MNRIENFYSAEAYREWNRLQWHRTEFAITMRCFDRYFNPSPLSILDVGGGPGRYAIALTQLGHCVTLLDIAPANVALALHKAEEQGVALRSAMVGTATDLTVFDDKSYDVVLLMGPLYHLIAEDDRKRAILEALRILKPGGLICASFINKFSPLRYAAFHDPATLTEHYRFFDEMIEHGTLQEPAGFTDIHVMHPSDISQLMEGFGVATLTLINCEGLVGGMDDRVNEAQGHLWEKWLDLNWTYCTDPTLLGTADHLLYIGKKAGDELQDDR